MSPCTLYVPSTISKTAHPGAGANIITPEFINAQFSQVFRPDDCALWDLNPGNFDKQMKGRRLLLLGDSLMHGNWGSLACLLREYVSFPSKSLPHEGH